MAIPVERPVPTTADQAIVSLEQVLEANPGRSASVLKEALRAADDNLAQRFRRGEFVDTLVRARAGAVDSLIRTIWRDTARDNLHDAALVAVGGYGRGELHPSSDVDVMVLLRSAEASGDWLSGFLTALWDVGLDIGHSVRTVEDCESEASANVSVVTTLIESRLLDGPRDLFIAMVAAVAPDRMWSSKQFFKDKRAEQVARHHRYDDTGYNLEPNVKGSPGGLRDIQMIAWVARRHFGSTGYAELVEHRFLTEGQLKLLIAGRSFLWRVRFALHMLTGRAENRLLFDHQKKLAELLGYEDGSYTLAVEQMMQRYYRTVMDLSRLNEMLLQLFEEAILLDPLAETKPINERFKDRNGFLQTTSDSVFEDNPSALLEAFVLLQQNPEIRGISAWTIGLIKRNLYLINDEFRQSPRNQRLFLQILRAPEGVTHELRRMNLYGVLGLYIPAFGRIVGRMQYDLFHAYTVDEHTLFVVSNLRKFALKRYNEEFPVCSRIMQTLDKPELAYLSGLFHDIAKGRGGDHSELGAVDARSFCLEHSFSTADAELVAWLVRHHLLLSMTAQKKDISDPAVIQEFAELVGNQVYLDHLYVLTVADVRGTNPRLWNSWKSSLFQELYSRTVEALGRGLENPAGRAELIAEHKHLASEELRADGIDPDTQDALWSTLRPEYFLRYRPDEIAWHTKTLSRGGAQREALLDVRPAADGVAVFLYTPQIYHTFAHTTAVLDELGLDILDARIIPDDSGYSLDTYIVHNHGDENNGSGQLAADIRKRLARIVERAREPASEWQPRVTRRVSRQAKMFSTPTTINFSLDKGKGRTVMELTTADRPGLLSAVGEVFLNENIDIETAKIVTIGEKAEDVFYITDLEKNPLTDARQASLRDALIKQLTRTNEN